MSDQSPTQELRSGLNAFQRELYDHLIAWKRKYVTTVPGIYRGKENDSFLPEAIQDSWPFIYPESRDALRGHLKLYPFRLHQFFHHVASSQAANINLFLPLLRHPQAAVVLRAIKPDIHALATDHLDGGFQLEFNDGTPGSLGDKSESAGTDVDIAIAYRNPAGALCLWLIEHKLTEREFSECGGYGSDGRKRKAETYRCEQTFDAILKDHGSCYYHGAKGYHYWTLSEQFREVFVRPGTDAMCPFRGGMNQLWRNLLLALSIKNKGNPYSEVHFSVVHHPRNTALEPTLKEFRNLIDNNTMFSTFTSDQVIRSAETHADADLNNWISWYKELYAV